ncbi:MAG: hypothetical protein ACKV22_15780 [Bryobacteraceae bacterium]
MRLFGLTVCLAAATFAAVEVEHVGGGGTAEAGAPVMNLHLVEPFGVDFDDQGNWYICEHKGERVVRVNPDGSTTLVAGTGSEGYSGDGGPATAAQFKDPHGIVITRNRLMYVADTQNHVVRKIDLRTGTITTIAGTGKAGFAGDGGPATAAQFNGTFGIAINRQQDQLYVADLGNRRVRKVDLKTGLITTLAGTGTKGVPPDGAKAADSPLVDPRAVAVDSTGNLYILERGGNALRVVNAPGVIRTLIGPGAVTPDLKGPKHLCVDRKGNVIIADAENNLVRLYNPRTGKTLTLAGTGKQGAQIEASDPTQTEVARPHGVTVDRRGRLWIVDSYNHRILRLTRYRTQ